MEARITLVIAEWNESVRQEIIAYWQGQEFVFSELQGEILRGQRGTLWGNMTSFNMRKLLATLTLSRPSPTEVLCALNINTIWQIITPADKASIQAEVDRFANLFQKHRFLLRASALPLEEAQSVLLRPAAVSSPTLAQEMLRPASEQE